MSGTVRVMLRIRLSSSFTSWPVPMQKYGHLSRTMPNAELRAFLQDHAQGKDCRLKELLQSLAACSYFKPTSNVLYWAARNPPRQSLRARDPGGVLEAYLLTIPRSSTHFLPKEEDSMHGLGKASSR